MKQTHLLLPLAALALAGSPALAAPQAPSTTTGEKAAEASIPFANHGGIWDWRSEGDQTVYFQDSHRQWYRATLFSPATELPFVEFIGIDASPSGALDKWSAVYIHGRRYPITSLVKVSGPPVSAKAKAKADAKAKTE